MQRFGIIGLPSHQSIRRADAHESPCREGQVEALGVIVNYLILNCTFGSVSN